MNLDLPQLEHLLDTDPCVDSWEFIEDVMKYLAINNLDITINKYVLTKNILERCSIVIYNGMTQICEVYCELNVSMSLPRAIVIATIQAVKEIKSV